MKYITLPRGKKGNIVRKYRIEIRLKTSWESCKHCISTSEVKEIFKCSFNTVTCFSVFRTGWTSVLSAFLGRNPRTAASLSSWDAQDIPGFSFIASHMSAMVFHSGSSLTHILSLKLIPSLRRRFHKPILVSLTLKPKSTCGQAAKFCYLFQLKYDTFVQLHVHQPSVFNCSFTA